MLMALVRQVFKLEELAFVYPGLIRSVEIVETGR